MKNTILTIFISALVAMLATYSFTRNSQSSNTATLQDSSNPVTVNNSQYGDQIAMLHDEIQELRQLMSTIQSPKVEKTINAEQQIEQKNKKAIGKQKLSEEEIQKITDEKMGKIREFVAQTHASEVVDDTWAISAQSKIDNVFNQENLRETNLIASDCRSTLCKIEIETKQDFDNTILQYGLVTELSDILPRSIANVVETGDGRKVTTVYMVKQGYPLPSLNQDSQPNEIEPN